MKYLNEIEQTARQLPHDVLEAGRKMWLAGVGAVGMIGNTTATLFDTLADEGERFQKKELKRVDRAVARTTETVNTAVSDVATMVESNAQEVTKVALNRLGMPTRRDVSELKSRVATLTTKVEALGRKGRTHVTN